MKWQIDLNLLYAERIKGIVKETVVANGVPKPLNRSVGLTTGSIENYGKKKTSR